MFRAQQPRDGSRTMSTQPRSGQAAAHPPTRIPCRSGAWSLRAGRERQRGGPWAGAACCIPAALSRAARPGWHHSGHSDSPAICTAAMPARTAARKGRRQPGALPGAGPHPSHAKPCPQAAPPCVQHVAGQWRLTSGGCHAHTRAKVFAILLPQLRHHVVEQERLAGAGIACARVPSAGRGSVGPGVGSRTAGGYRTAPHVMQPQAALALLCNSLRMARL